MFHLITEIQIEATPDQVWDVLTDFPAHALWNPFIQSLSGILVSFARSGLNAGTSAGFVAMNQALKDRVESLPLSGVRTQA